MKKDAPIKERLIFVMICKGKDLHLTLTLLRLRSVFRP